MAQPCDDFDSNECQEAIHALYQYLDGQLTIERRRIIKTHIDLCSGCLSTYEFEIELRQVVSKRCTDQVPESLRARVFEALQRDNDDPR